MPATSVNGFSVGTDVSFSIMDDYGDVFSEDMLGLMTEFDIRSTDVRMKVTPINNGGIPINQTVANGVRGQMSFVRVSGAFQQMYIDLQNAYYESGTIPQFTIVFYIRNRDGSVDECMITGVQFSDWNFGNFRGTKEVDLRIALEGSQMTTNGSLGSTLAGVG